MNRLISIFFFLVILSISGCDTADSVQPRNEDFFVKMYSGLKAGDQFGVDVIETSDGGLLIAGTSSSQESTILLIKTDIKGNELWTFAADSILGIASSTAESVIELPDSYLVGGTVDEGSIKRSILIRINFDGSFTGDSTYITTGLETNRLSKITFGNSRILVCGETDLPIIDAVGTTVGGINGYIKLYDLNLNPILVVGEEIQYFGTKGDDHVTGAYEITNTNLVGGKNTRFLAFGSSDFDNSPTGFDFYYIGFNDLFVPSPGMSSSTSIERTGNQFSNYLTEFNDTYWMIGKSEEGKSQIFFDGWEFSTGGIVDWTPILGSPLITTNAEVVGQGIAIQDIGKYVIVGDVTFTANVQEVYLARVNSNRDIEEPWPKTFGTETSTYSAGAVTILQDGSIVIVGTADLEPIKKIVIIKTGPDGQMRF